jgi:hypothetical protein
MINCSSFLHKYRPLATGPDTTFLIDSADVQFNKDKERRQAAVKLR